MASELHRTAITRLEVTDDAATRIEETITEWQRGANIAADAGWEHGGRRKTKLQSLVYDDVRERTELGIQHAILAIHQACEALRSVYEVRSTGRRASKPMFTSPTVRYDARTMTLFEDEEQVSLSTTGERVSCGLALPEEEDGYQYQYLCDEDWELAESTLTARDGEYFLHIGFRKSKPEATYQGQAAGDRTVLGVDLGIENLAVTSTARFLSGRELLHKHREFERVRAGLQQTGTQSAHRTYRRRGAAEARYNQDYLHGVANSILEEASAYDCDCIAFENLTHIRDSLPSHRKFHHWAHNQLVKYVEYKAEEQGIAVVFVDPRDTSRRCSECGHTSKSNRPTRDHFECEQCGAEANADYNAAKNVGLRYARCGQQSSQRTGNGRLALKSGTVTPDSGFSPYTAEDTDKSAPSKATHHG